MAEKETKELERQSSEELRLENLKKASLAIYRDGIGIKDAAKRFHVTFADLKYFYENEAQDFLPLDDGDEDDY